MRFEEVALADAAGSVLATPLVRASGQKVLAKGRRLTPEDVALLRREGLQTVWVVRLETTEIDEDSATNCLRHYLVRGPVRAEAGSGGKLAFHATEPVVLEVDAGRLARLNQSGVCVAATVAQWSLAEPGAPVVFLKTRPFAVDRARLEEQLQYLRTEGPVAVARAAGRNRMTVIYTDPVAAHRAEELLGPAVVAHAEQHGLALRKMAVPEQPGPLAAAIHRAAAEGAHMILLATTTAPACPEDAIGHAFAHAGVALESFLAPVEPGVLLFLGYLGEVPVIAAPGCLRAKGPDVLSFILPALRAGVRLSSVHLAGFAIGGLVGGPRKRAAAR